jgi:DNA mismatch repair protein MLH3
VRDLFGNMPVRVKQRVEESRSQSGSGREWEELRKLVTSLALVWPFPVRIVVRDSVSGQKLQLRGTKPLRSPSGNTQREAKLITHVCNTLSQAMFISSPDQSKWVSTRASTPRIRIRGAISKEPAPTKVSQFISLGIEPLSIQYGHSVLYDEINRLFENSSFGNEDESSSFDAAQLKRKHGDRVSKSDEFTTTELRGSRKRFERWPMFFIQIEFLDPITEEVELGTTEDIVEDKKGSLSSVVELLKAMVFEFLKSHSFRPRITRPIHISRNGELESAGNISEGVFRAGRSNGPVSQSLNAAQAQRTGSPFDTWSRIKSGRPKPPSSILEQLYQPKSQVSNGGMDTHVSIARISDRDMYSSLKSDLNSPSLERNAATIARSGKVIRPPFDGLSPMISKTLSAPQSAKDDLSVPSSKRTNGEEQCLNWVNPITKMDSIINGRTGLVTQPSKTDRLTPRIVSYLNSESHDNPPISDHVASTDDTERNPRRCSTWINDILRNWNNPIYRPTESSIPQASTGGPGNKSQQLLHGHRHDCTQIDITREFQEISVCLDGRISKEALRRADVISQVDCKFILIKISTSSVSSNDDSARAAGEMLVIVDQHAADERCRVEELFQELCSPLILDECTTGVASPQSGVLTTLLEKPISFIMPQREIQLLQMHAQHFANWGIIYDVPHAGLTTDQHQEYKVTVKSLPPSIIERCATVPKLLVELLRSELWKYSERGPTLKNAGIETDSTDTSMKHPWLGKIHSCPQAILEMLNSRACRSKFSHSIHSMGF